MTCCNVSLVLSLDEDADRSGTFRSSIGGVLHARYERNASAYPSAACAIVARPAGRVPARLDGCARGCFHAGRRRELGEQVGGGCRGSLAGEAFFQSLLL